MAENIESKPKVSRPKRVWRILCEIVFGLLFLIAGLVLLGLVLAGLGGDPILPLAELIFEHITALLVIECCLWEPVFSSLGVFCGGKFMKGKGKLRFTTLLSVISSLLGFLICIALVWYDNHYPPSPCLGCSRDVFYFGIVIYYLPLIIIAPLVGAIIGYERSDKRERKRLEKSETS